jgi:hypothetical protein
MGACHPGRREAAIRDGGARSPLPPESGVSRYPGDRSGQTAWRPTVSRTIAGDFREHSGRARSVPDRRFAASGMTSLSRRGQLRPQGEKERGRESLSAEKCENRYSRPFEDLRLGASGGRAAPVRSRRGAGLSKTRRRSGDRRRVFYRGWKGRQEENFAGGREGRNSGAKRAERAGRESRSGWRLLSPPCSRSEWGGGPRSGGGAPTAFAALTPPPPG